MIIRNTLIVIISLLLISSCEKWEDKPGPRDPRLDNPYCDDPDAVNYNWNFPGRPDNSVCFYPTELFKGEYIYVDTIYDATFEYDTFFTYSINIRPISNTKMLLSGLCSGGTGDSLKLTADRYYKATVDSIKLSDSTYLPGRFFCKMSDTISGEIKRDKTDSTKIRVNFTIATDSGLRYHIGTGVRK